MSDGNAASVGRRRVASIILAVPLLAALGWCVFRFAPAGLLLLDRPTVVDPSARLTGTILSIAGAPAKGDRGASLAVVEFSDFQCPFCGAFARTTEPLLTAAYVDTGRVVWAFRNRPLPMHRSAAAAAKASMCAAAQGQFWVAHDALFADQANIGRVPFSKRTSQFGVSTAPFVQCLSAPGQQLVDDDNREANRLRIIATPTFIVGHVQRDGTIKVLDVLEGNVPADKFRSVLEGHLVAR